MTDTTRRIRFVQTLSTGREVFLAGETYDVPDAEATDYLRECAVPAVAATVPAAGIVPAKPTSTEPTTTRAATTPDELPPLTAAE